MMASNGTTTTIQPMLVPTPRQKKQPQQQIPKSKMTKSQRKAHLKQAKYMYEERKRLGGRITKKEEDAWRQFLESMADDGKKLQQTRGRRKNNNNQIPKPNIPIPNDVITNTPNTRSGSGLVNQMAFPNNPIPKPSFSPLQPPPPKPPPGGRLPAPEMLSKQSMRHGPFKGLQKWVNRGVEPFSTSG